jgi:uncharacterized membrane protein YfcA
LWLLPLGFVIGTFGTLIGAGGGFILLPLLLILYPEESPDLLTSISLAVVFFNALSGSVAYARMGRIHYGAGVLFAAASVPGAVLGALTTYYIPRHAFDVICGVGMLAMAAYLLARPGGVSGQEAKTAEPEPVSVNDIRYNRSLGSALSLGVGYVSSLLGIGGGIIHVPALVRLLNFPVHNATATSHFILCVMALSGTVVHIASGTFQHGVRRTLMLAVGVVIGAQVGALFSTRVHGKWIIRSLAVALAVVGVRVLVQVF